MRVKRSDMRYLLAGREYGLGRGSDSLHRGLRMDNSNLSRQKGESFRSPKEDSLQPNLGQFALGLSFVGANALFLGARFVNQGVAEIDECLLFAPRTLGLH